jgi:hypothetical protein
MLRLRPAVIDLDTLARQALEAIVQWNGPVPRRNLSWSKCSNCLRWPVTHPMSTVGYPISHWTARELATAAIQAGIFTRISTSNSKFNNPSGEN